MGSKANCDCHGHHLQGFYYTPLHILFPVIHTAAVLILGVSSVHHNMSCSRSFTQLQSLGSPLYTTTCPVPGHSHNCSPHFWGLLCTSQHVLFPVIHTAAVLIFGVSSVHHNMSRSQSFTQVQSLSSGSARYITMFCPQSFQQLQALSLGVSLYHMPCPQSFQQLQTLSLGVSLYHMPCPQSFKLLPSLFLGVSTVHHCMPCPQ